MQNEKTVDQKLKECKQVYIQNLQRNAVQKNMVFMYLKQHKIDPDVRQLTMNSRQGITKLQFENHQKAKNFYDNYNFKGAILMRPFNIYFNLQLTDAEMKKFYLEGITQENQRKLFDAARKIGVCKIYTNYTQPNRGKIKPNGVLSFIRKDELLEKEMTQLKAELSELGIKIQKYVAEKDLKCSIRITNFYKGDLSEEDQSIIKKGEDQLRAALEKVVKDPIVSLTVNVKRKENDTNNQPKPKSVSALLQFTDSLQTMDNFQIIRRLYQDQSDTKAILYLHNDENNSYMSLFTNNLAKPEDLNEKQFESKLLEEFKKVNPNVIQVNIYPVPRSGTYVGRVYLKTQIDGKNFIVDYTSKRELLFPFFKDNNSISFNINVDTKTLVKIKHAEKKAGEMMNRIKNTDQTLKRAKKQQNQMGKPMPIMQGSGFVGMPMQQGGLIQGPGMQMQPGPMMGGMPIFSQPPNMMVGSNIPPPMMMRQDRPQNFRASAAKLIRDKEMIMKEQPTTVKRILYNTLKAFVEEQGVSSAQSPVTTDLILKTNNLDELFKFLENGEELKNKIKQLKNL